VSQSDLLAELRGRAGTLLAAASLVTSFLGGAVLASPTLEKGVVIRPPISSWGWLAIVAFRVIGLVTLTILWPYIWRFEMNPLAIVDAAEAASVAPADLKRDLTGYHWQNFESNQFKLDWLFWAFRLGALSRRRGTRRRAFKTPLGLSLRAGAPMGHP
jgi:hypothetical protein